MPDTFFSQTHCDRCPKPLAVRIMSWFTTETICMDCNTKELTLRRKLRKSGVNDLKLEGCGYIPDEPLQKQ